MIRWFVRCVALAIGLVLIAAGPSTRTLGFLVVAVNVVAAFGFGVAGRNGSIAPGEFSRGYRVGAPEAFAALRSALEHLGYNVMSVESDRHALSFNTGISWKTWGGQDFTATIQNSADPNITEIELVGATSQRGIGGLQSVSWGETTLLGERVLDRIESELAGSQPTKTEFPRDPSPTSKR